MAKKKKAQLEAWCWYCDREFEDDKVLLQHQKAKHYKCPYCPRRLNTAGGLTVHLHQVHKAEPTVIENALPGRDSFDIEIYGMVGIPEADLAEWKARKASSGQSMNGGGSGQPAAKRQKVENVALTPEQLKAQLEAHKALMSGQAPPPGSMPPAGFPPSGPPPAFPPYGPPPGFPAGPPPGFGGPPPPPFGNAQFGGPPPRPWPGAPQYSGPPPNITVPQPSPHQEAIKAGQKSRMVYNHNTLSPEENLALSAKYAFVDPDDPTSAQQPQPGPSHLGSGAPPGPQQQPPQPYYAGPPPPTGTSASASPYAYAPPPHVGTPHYPPLQTGYSGMMMGSQSPHGPPPGFASPHSGYQQHHGQPAYSGPPPGYAPPAPSAVSPPPQGSRTTAESYPAVPPEAQPAAAQPEANTAEALAATNEQVGRQESMTGAARDGDVRAMESQADKELQEDEAQNASLVVDEKASGQSVAPTATQESETSSAPKLALGKRAKAADLF